jgi:hypothetical protein
MSELGSQICAYANDTCVTDAMSNLVDLLQIRTFDGWLARATARSGVQHPLVHKKSAATNGDSFPHDIDFPFLPCVRLMDGECGGCASPGHHSRRSAKRR